MTLTACTILALAAFVPAEPPKAQPQRAKWEYKEVDFDDSKYEDVFGDTEGKKTIEAMNKLGKDGWEVVSIANVHGNPHITSDIPWRVFYKRLRDSAERRRWEYSVANVQFAKRQGQALYPPSDSDQLTKLGEEGWELACIARRQSIRGEMVALKEGYVYLLKRPL